MAATSTSAETNTCKSVSTSKNGKLPFFHTPCCHEEMGDAEVKNDIKDAIRNRVRKDISWPTKCKDDIKVEISSLPYIQPNIHVLPRPKSVYWKKGEHKYITYPERPPHPLCGTKLNGDCWKYLYKIFNK